MNQFHYFDHKFKDDCIEISLSDEILRIIAFFLMVIDQVSFYTNFETGIIIGRLSMPIFLYLLIKGSERTSNNVRYFYRLFSWGLISQIVMFVCDIPVNSMNILLTLCLCLIFLQHKNKFQWLGVYCVAAEFLNFDYGWYGVVCCYLIYLWEKYYRDWSLTNEGLWTFLWVLINLLQSIENPIQIMGVAPIVVIKLLKSTERKRVEVPKFTRSLWYASYPLQWMVLSIIF